MDVLIRFDRDQPPAGTVFALPEREPAEGVAFVGWLGLLRALAEVLGHAAEPAAR